MRPRTHVWKLFTTLLYGQQGWIKRLPQGHITVQLRPLCTLLTRRPEYVHDDLRYLNDNLLLLSNLTWNEHYFTAKLALPPTTAWMVNTSSEPCIEIKDLTCQ